MVECGILWTEKKENKMSRRIKAYDRETIKDENGKYIYTDMKRRIFLTDAKTEERIAKVLGTKHWTFSTFIRLAIDYYISAIEDDDLDEFAGRL